MSTGIVGVIIERVLRPLENKDFDLMLIGTIGFGVFSEYSRRRMPSPPQNSTTFINLFLVVISS